MPIFARFLYRASEPEKDGKFYTLVHLIGSENAYSFSLAHCHELVDELKKTFPQAKDENIIIKRTIKSGSFYDERMLIEWMTYEPCKPRESYPGYQLIEVVKNSHFKMKYRTRE